MIFLFFKHCKGTTNDGPNENVDKLKYCSSSLTTVGWGTLRPPNDDSYSEDWGVRILESNTKEGMSFEQYCVLNSCTEDGLNDIAKYNDYQEEWNKTKQTFNDNTSMAEKRFVLIKLHAKHRNKRKYHLDPIEGGHRRAGIFQANFCAQLNPEDGSISGCLTYTPGHFRNSRMTPKEGITTEHILGAYISKIDQGSKSEGFFAGKTLVHVKYLSNKDVSVPKLLRACQICSEGIGREKRNSASKDVFVELAKCTDEFLRQMSDNALRNRPCLGKFAYPSANKFPKTTISKELPVNFDWKTDRKKIESNMRLASFLYTDICENYCKSPFAEENYANFMNELEVPRLLDRNEDASVLLKPPFIVSYDSMAVDAGLGTQQRATAEMLNKWCMLPMFIHILWAHKMNMTLIEAAKDPKVAQIVIYAMRHHVHNHGFSNLGGHGCMVWYGLNATPVMAESSYQVVMAALYLTEIINATLTTIYDNDGSIKNEDQLTSVRREKLIKETHEVSMLFSTMNIYANSPGTDKMISELGKQIAFCKYFFNAGRPRLTMTCFFSSFLIHGRRRTCQQSEEVNKSRQKGSCTSRSTNVHSLDQLYQ